jgi:hypothetical protein
MAQAEKRLTPATRPSNGEPPVEQLSTHQAAVALVSLLNGASQIPAVRHLRSIVRRACRARIISARGGRRHG